MTALKTEFLKYRDNETGVEQLYEVIPPVPTESDRGGIIASPKTDAETVEAKLGDDGKLYVPEGTKDYNQLENVPTKLSDFENDLEIVNSWNDLTDKPERLSEFEDDIHFIVNVTTEDMQTFTSDKTYAEIKNAFDTEATIIGYLTFAPASLKIIVPFEGIVAETAIFHFAGASIYNDALTTELAATAMMINDDGVSLSNVAFNIGNVSTLTTESKELVGAINEVHNEVNSIEIPEQVQANWNETEESSSAFIANKPFYVTKDPEVVYLLPETTFTLDENKEFEGENTYGVTLEADKKYNVTFNGVVYENLLCINVSGQLMIGSYNLQLTDYPFMITCNETTFAVKCSAETENCVLSISLSDLDQGEMYVESKYAPHFQADWNEEDKTAIGYIKNKPFGSVIEDVVLIKSADLKFAENGSYMFLNLYVSTSLSIAGLDVNQEYEVTWDDQVYNLIPRTHDAVGTYLGAEYLGLDNQMCDFSECPFCIVVQETDSFSMAMIATESTEETHTVGIVARNVEIIDQIDEKYIPDTIARMSNISEVEESISAIETNIDEIEADIIALDNVFIATYGETTYSEIHECYDSGKIVFCIYNNTTCPLVDNNAARCVFSRFDIQENTGTSIVVKVEADNTWSVTEYKVPALEGSVHNGIVVAKMVEGYATFDSVEVLDDTYIPDTIARVGSDGSLEATALILSSPNGTRFQITIGDDGVLTATEIEVTTE